MVLDAEKKRKGGPCRGSNPGPLAPKARIIPLDHRATHKHQRKIQTQTQQLQSTLTPTHTRKSHNLLLFTLYLA